MTRLCIITTDEENKNDDAIGLFCEESLPRVLFPTEGTFCFATDCIIRTGMLESSNLQLLNCNLLEPKTSQMFNRFVSACKQE